jgi:hypothetical protein
MRVSSLNHSPGLLVFESREMEIRGFVSRVKERHTLGNEWERRETKKIVPKNLDTRTLNI